MQIIQIKERTESVRDSAIQRNRRKTIIDDTPANRTHNNNNNTPTLPKPSNEQLSCLYNNCVKLLNENVTSHKFK